VDHDLGIMQLLARGRDPFDPEECVTLCATCSSQKDVSAWDPSRAASV
jgi:hypothetical protein